MSHQVCAAITNRRLLSAFYEGGSRTIEPYCHGFSKSDDELLRAFQISGFSQSGESTGWKLFRLDRLEAISVLDRGFAPRAGYNPDDPAIRRIHCRV